MKPLTEIQTGGNICSSGILMSFFYVEHTEFEKSVGYLAELTESQDGDLK